jgi:hypothetical protein
MASTLTLYSTSDCHLCEQALALVRSMPELRRYSVIEVDVANDDDAFARYGARIPVLVRANPAREIAWPFNADDVLTLLG